ncbi:MAG: PQQ-binding-like beta-propeller repeat protein [Planctomycetota bacterium]|nr:PQQ-binding-like beta-propeller repeat protein [Planctomycetota bacterium]
MKIFNHTSRIVFAFVSLAYADDWPAYRHDIRRSGVTEEELNFPLNEKWSFENLRPPSPAWDEPGVEMNRLDFDYALQPVVSDGLVFFGSSTDDTVRAIETMSGKVRWRFTTNGPVRFAPQIDDGRCHFASDDGLAYCLDAKSGTLLWSFRTAFDSRQISGNSRIISRWPCRAGILVDRGVVYVTAGMWPSEGILVYALDAKTGKEIWCNDTSGGKFMLYPHGGSLAIGGVAPQGYLLASDDKLLVPTGRSVPAAFDRQTGRLHYYRIGENRANGGWRAIIAGESFYSGAHGAKWQMSGKWEKFGPRPGDGMRSFNLATGNAKDEFPERHFVVDDGKVIYAAGNGTVEAIQNGKTLWQASHPRVFSFVRAGNVLLVGGTDTVSALNLSDGSLAWKEAADGEVRGIAVAGGDVFTSTHKGVISCFRTGVATKAVEEISKSEETESKLPKEALDCFTGINLTRMTRGYALVTGSTPLPVEDAVIKQTGLNVVRLYLEKSDVETSRQRFLNSNLYGTRISVRHLENSAELSLPDFFANLVVVAGNSLELSADLYRVLRPCGGVMCFTGSSLPQQEQFIREAKIPDSEVRKDERGYIITRGKLPGALDWDSEAANDQRLKWPLELAWFGGPGPARMANRHQAFMPAVANGRYFAVGNHHLMAVDAYNGLDLWVKEINSLAFNLGQLTADDETVYVFLQGSCLALDAQTGATRKVFIKEGIPGEGQAPWKDLPPHALKSRGMPEASSAGKREHPLTGKRAAKAYQRAYGCGSVISSAGMHFFRSATLGVYDLEDDSGLRNFSGVRPACAMSMIPALGLLIANEGSGGCVCSYNFQTSLALSPARVSRQEDWAVFFDEPAKSILGHVALNLGAPGDRRDENRSLWLGMPRPTTGMQIPCEIGFDENLGFDRINADRNPIEGTTRPWLYTSAVYGLRRLVLNLENFAPIVALKAAIAPAVDGKLDDKCWDNQFPLQVNDEKSKVFLRYDKDHLYLAYRRPAEVDRRGNVEKWKDDIRENDAEIWQDHSCEVAISDARKQKVVHLGMSAGAASYDGLWSHTDLFPAYDIPRLTDISIDGNDDDWQGRGLHVMHFTDPKGNARMPENLDPSLFIGWSDLGLLLYLKVRDNAVVEYPAQASMWSKDSIELFMSENRESQNRFHLCIGPGADGKQPEARAYFWDRRVDKSGAPLSVAVNGKRTPDGYAVELMLPWSNLRIRPELGGETALQVMVNDSDQNKPDSRDWFRVAWHPDGHTGFKPHALQRLLLTNKTSPPVMMQRAPKPDKAGLVRTSPPVITPTINVPRLDGIDIDGNINDWEGRGFHQASLAAQDGTMKTSSSDFDPSFRLGWNKKGLLLAGLIVDQNLIADPDAEKLWRKDSVEIFMSEEVGSKESFQLTIAPPSEKDAKPEVFLEDHRYKAKSSHPLKAQVFGRRTEGGYSLEILIPWQNLNIDPNEGKEFGLQAFFNDSDNTDAYPGDWFRVAWYPVGHAGWNPLAYHRLRLSEMPSDSLGFERGERVNDDRVLATKLPWLIPRAIMGKTGEDSQWNAPWQGAVQANQNAFVCELAIPWKTLSEAGLDTGQLLLDFSHRGRITERPSWSFVPFEMRETAQRPPQPYTVRLHFAELNNVKPGERVFDVKLQGTPVLQTFDVVLESGRKRTALVREFTGIMAGNQIELECVSGAKTQTWESAPILNGFEVIPE